MNQQNNTPGKPGSCLVFACSGAADLGAIADLAARKLSQEKAAAMCCTAAIAAEIPEIMEKARAADRLVVIDGCAKECARIVLERNGFHDFAYVQLEDFGMDKGKTPVTEERVAAVADEARKHCCP